MTSAYDVSSSIPKVDDVIEYAKISKLVHTVTSKEDQAALSNSCASPLTLHYYEKNASDSIAMVVSSSSMKYVGVVFGGREGDWEKLRAMPLREMGPYTNNSNLPFPIGFVDGNDGDDDIVVKEMSNNIVDSPKEPISTTEELKLDVIANTENSPATNNTDVTNVKNTEKEEQDEKLVDVELSGGAKRESIEIHPGINNALFSDNLHDNIEKALNSVIPDHPLNKIIVTGHGMGAAMATIFAAYLCKQKPILEVSVVNFGSPRIGSDKFCKWINEIPNLMIWRYIFRFDAVAGIPSVAIGFRHVGHMMHLNEGEGTKAYCYTGTSNSAGESMGYVSPPELLTPFGELGQEAVDHNINLYIQFLEEKSKLQPRTYYASRFQRESKSLAPRLLEKAWNILDKTCGSAIP